MKPMDVIRVASALQQLPEGDFKAVMKRAYPQADDEYIEGKWRMFIGNPLYFVMSRHPIKPGIMLIERVMELHDLTYDIVPGNPLLFISVPMEDAERIKKKIEELGLKVEVI